MLEELEGAVGGVLAPAGDPAPRAAPVVEPEVELVVAGGQADGVDGGGGEVDDLVDGENGEVVVEAGEVEARMLDELDDGVLLVRHALGRIEAAGIVLAHSHLQQAKNLKNIFNKRNKKVLTIEKKDVGLKWYIIFKPCLGTILCEVENGAATKRWILHRLHHMKVFTEVKESVIK